MADDKIQTQIIADPAAYVAGMRRAVESTKAGVEQIKNSLNSLTQPFERLKNAMLGIAAVAAGGAVFKNFVDEALQAAREVNLLKNSFGLSTEKADDLAFHLKRLGITTEEYVGMAIKLDRQLKTGNETLQKMGFTSRDVFLTQEQLMDKALKKLMEYEPGTHRNIAAMVMFGKTVQEVYPLLRTQIAGAKERSEELDKALNQSINDDKLTIVKRYKVAMNELGLSFDAIKEAIGFAVMPYLTRFAEFITEKAPTIVSTMKETTTTVINWMFDLAKSFLTVVSRAAVGLYNLAVIVEHLKVKFGWTTQEESDSFLKKFSDQVDALVEKIPNWKKQIDELRNAVTSDSFKARWDAMGDREPAEKKGGKKADNLLTDKTALKVAQEDFRERTKLAADNYTFESNQINSLAQRYIITENQKTNLLMEELEKRHQAEMLAADKLIAASRGNAVAYKKALNERLDLDRKYMIDRAQLINASYARERQEIAGYVGSIEGSWNGQLRNILAGTVGFGQAVKSVFADFVMYCIQQLQKKFIFEKVTNALSAAFVGETEGVKTAAVTAGVAARASAESGGFAVSLAKTVGDALAKIGAFVGEIFAGLTAWLVPIFGPAAPAAAMGIALGVGAGAAALISSIPKYEQGTPYVPNTGLALLHRGEAVVPASMNSGTAGGVGGGMNVTIQAMDGASVGAWLRGGGALQIAKHLGKVYRDNPSLA